MRQVTAIIEKGSDGRYSSYVEDRSYPYGIIGTGATVKETIDDFMAGYEEMKEFITSKGETFEEAEFIFKYDIPSFLQDFAYAFSLAGLERITGVNQKLLGHYISGYRKPSAKTAAKIQAGIHQFSDKLASVRFV